MIGQKSKAKHKTLIKGDTENSEELVLISYFLATLRKETISLHRKTPILKMQILKDC